MNKKHCPFPYANVCLEEAFRCRAIHKFQKFRRMAHMSDIRFCRFQGLLESSSFIHCLLLQDVAFFYFFLLTQRFPGFKNVSSGLYMSHRRLSHRRFWIMWLWRCSLLGFISFSASAVHISFSSNSASKLQKSRAVTFMQNSHCLWDLSEVIQGPFLGSGGV